MNIRFDDQVVIVTGGTRGIGRKIAEDFESLGAYVIITGTSTESPSFSLNRNFEYYSVDFTNHESAQKFLDILKQKQKIDICVNNAGINRINFLEDVDDLDYSDMLKVNINIPFKITQVVSGIMKKNQYGKIINISSIFGKVSKEKRSVYSITKFAIKGLTVSTSIELAKHGVLVNTVSPGFTLTDLTKKNLKESEREDLVKLIPIQRMAEVGEISSVVLFLSSKFNTYITGQNIIVDGGYTNA